MENQSQQDQTGVNQAGEDQTNQKRGWFGMWGLLVVLFVFLVGACVYWGVTMGLGKAFESDQFAYLGVVTILVGVCISARMTVQMLRDGYVIDRRNYIDMSRAQWFKRRGSSKTDESNS